MSNFSTSGSEGQCVWSWVGGDKEQSLVVSATDNERSVCLAVILLVWIRWPRLPPGSWPLSCCSAFLFSARSLNLLAKPVVPVRADQACALINC